MCPDEEDQCVDRENPQHEDEDRMGIVGKVYLRTEPLEIVS